MTQEIKVSRSEGKEAFVRSYARIESLRKKGDSFRTRAVRDFWNELFSELVGRMDVYRYSYTSPGMYDCFYDPHHHLPFMNQIFFYFNGVVSLKVQKDDANKTVCSYISFGEEPSLSTQQLFIEPGLSEPSSTTRLGDELKLNPNSQIDGKLLEKFMEGLL